MGKVLYCDLIERGPGHYQCTREACRKEYHSDEFTIEQMHKVCDASDFSSGRTGHRITEGPGTELHKIIKWLFGATVTQKCGCQQWIDRMNAWGVAGCRDRTNNRQIIDWLVKQAEEYQWTVTEIDDAGNETEHDTRPPWIVSLARLAMKVPGGKHPVRWQCQLMVSVAIKRAEENEKEKAAEESREAAKSAKGKDETDQAA